MGMHANSTIALLAATFASAACTASVPHASAAPRTPTFAQIICPAGAAPVATPDGQWSCAYTSAASVKMGDEPALSRGTADALAAEANRTGQAQAYSDGEYTVTITPPPES